MVLDYSRIDNQRESRRELRINPRTLCYADNSRKEVLHNINDQSNIERHYINIMPFGIDRSIIQIPTLQINVPEMPEIPKNLKDCLEIKKYLDKIQTQIDELNYRMNLPSDCKIVNIQKLMEFMKKYPDFTIPTKQSVSDDLKTISSCSEAKTYLQQKSDQLDEMLIILTVSKYCKYESISAINYQTKAIEKKIPDIDSQKNTYTEKTKYQTEMYNSVKYVNEILLIFYALLFSIIHILLLVQYIQGVKRDEIADTIWLTILFSYPYLIYYIEKTIYSSIMYFLSLIYGATYVYQFDKLLLFTDFYTDPDEKSPKVASSL